MQIVIVGAGGLVGKEFTRHFSIEHQVVALKHDDLNIADREAVRQTIINQRPALIINCAVLGVDDCELEPSRAWNVNVMGAENLAEAASDIDAELLHLSTNYVFDGNLEADSFYTIEDFPAPINIYGQTKLAAERAVKSICKRSFIIRTSWVFGVGKKSFLSTAHHSLNAASRIRAITDIWASSTYVRDLAERVDEILLHQHYSTYHVVNSGICSYYDFALEAARVLKISDKEITHLIEPVKVSEIQFVAQRPRYTPMRCIVSDRIGLAPMRDWRLSIVDYIRGQFSW
ncbi:MAG: dTDP-4-dehydrorhamnose reductase [Pyrinomonadaceae bacterium]|jgi:dTDP-4-dehydrorhamnose reductase|nr:dTDP-4-dehydrorhamnose reductase [Pyrinomonadaceae bacterium]